MVYRSLFHGFLWFIVFTGFLQFKGNFVSDHYRCDWALWMALESLNVCPCCYMYVCLTRGRWQCLLDKFIFHLQWLRALPSSRQSFNMVFGECPYCSKVRKLFIGQFYMYIVCWFFLKFKVPVTSKLISSHLILYFLQ